jgi:hypothetical protein
MRKKLVSTGNSLALVPDKASRKRAAKLRKIVEQAHRNYAGVFKRLAE